MKENDGGGVLQDSRLEDLPRVHYRGGEASHADRMVADRPVLAIKRDHEKVRVSEFFDGGVFSIIDGFGLDRTNSPTAVPGSVPV